jgi:hypothetical protein
VSFINTSEHQKFISQCQHIIRASSENGSYLPTDPNTERLKADLEALQGLVETYVNTISQIPVLSKEYNYLQKQIRIRVRRIQKGNEVKQKKKTV